MRKEHNWKLNPSASLQYRGEFSPSTRFAPSHPGRLRYRKKFIFWLFLYRFSGQFTLKDCLRLVFALGLNFSKFKGFTTIRALYKASYGRVRVKSMFSRNLSNKALLLSCFFSHSCRCIEIEEGSYKVSWCFICIVPFTDLSLEFCLFAEY